MKFIKVYRKAKRYFFRKLYFVFSVIPIKENKITFASDSRTKASGNIEYIYEELLKKDVNLDISFLFKESINRDKSIIFIIKMAWLLSRSKLIILDDFYPMIYHIKIRKNAKLIQLWHAAGAFKTFGFSRVGLVGGPTLNSKNHRNYSKVFVSSHNVAKYYAEGFGIEESKIIPLGVPRTDLFFDENKKQRLRKEIFIKYPNIKDKKVILFAPTFRGNGQSSAYYPHEWLDYDEIHEKLKDDNCIFLLKFHPFIKNKYKIPNKYQDFFIDVSEHREINELLLVTEVLVTDYSSVIFEFALLNKKMVFFAPDLSEYIADRGFYFNYEKLIPGPIVNKTSKLIEELKSSTTIDYYKMKSFIDYFFDSTDGQASKRIAEYLLNEM